MYCLRLSVLSFGHFASEALIRLLISLHSSQSHTLNDGLRRGMSKDSMPTACFACRPILRLKPAGSLSARTRHFLEAGQAR
jgi:hypothetical protein